MPHIEPARRTSWPPWITSPNGEAEAEITAFQHIVLGTATTASSTGVIVYLEDARTATGEMYPLRDAGVQAEWTRLHAMPEADPAYNLARTPLGAKLRSLRAKILQSGEPLLDWDDIEREVADRRGEAEKRGT